MFVPTGQRQGGDQPEDSDLRLASSRFVLPSSLISSLSCRPVVSLLWTSCTVQAPGGKEAEVRGDRGPAAEGW